MFIQFPKYSIAVCAAALLCATANAETTHSVVDGVLTIDVPSGEEESFNIGWTTVPEGDPAVTNIVKRGAGKMLSPNNISTYTGDFDIEEGIWCCTDNGAGSQRLGATSTTAYSGTIHVRDGASIEYAGDNTKGDSLSGKTVHLYGAGAADATQRAKIFLSSNKTMADPGFGKNVKIIMHDDTLFYSKNRLKLTGLFDLGGNKLTLYSNAHDLGGSVTNGGAIVLSNRATFMTEGGSVTFAPDCAENAYIEITAGSTLNLKSKQSFANGWTIKNNGGAIAGNTSFPNTKTDFPVWDGPVELSGASKIANYTGSASIPTTVFNLKEGPISGSGTLAVGPGWLNLHVQENGYSGAVSVTSVGHEAVPAGAGGIGVCGGASVFTNASSITFNDSSRFEFMDEVPAKVGALTFAGDVTQSIKGGSATNRSTIAGLIKTGTNTLVVSSPAHFTGAVTISNGVLKIPYLSVKGTPGLTETHLTPVSPGNPTWDDGYIWAGSSWNGTNNKWPISRPWLENYRQHLNYYEKGVCAIGPRCGLRPMINNENKGNPHWSDGYSGGRNGWWYRGYVWNNSDEPVTYTFWSGLTGNAAAIYFGEDHDMLFFPTDTSSELYAEHSVKLAAAKTYTLQPGATPVDIIVWANGGSATLWSYEFPSTSERYGIVFAPSTVSTAEALNAQIVAFYNEANTNAVRDTLRQFNEFKDNSGIGSLFTANIYDDSDGDKKVALLPVFDDLKFENSTTLDLDNNIDFLVKNLAGSPIVTNAVRFTVTNNWTICSADFPKADSSVRHPMTVDGKLVFAEGATFSIDDELTIDRSSAGIVVATATGGIEGNPKQAVGLSKQWKLKIAGNEARLCSSGGLFVILR